MDAFQVRMDFQALLRRLNASQQSIEKVLSFADRHIPKAAADLWDCILIESGKSSLSSRLNILFLLDFLFTDYSSRYSQRLINDFRRMAAKDLHQLIDQVVPSNSLNGVKLNSGVTIQLLSSWRIKRLFPQDQLTLLLATLQERISYTLHSKAAKGQRGGEQEDCSALSHAEIMRRIEEDRERHKRVREKLWVLPPKSYFDAVPDISSSQSSSSNSKPQSQQQQQQQQQQGGPSDATERPLKRVRLDGALEVVDSSRVGSEVQPDESSEMDSILQADPLEIQFEELWETTSDLNQDDLDAWHEEADQRWWGSEEQIRKRREGERVAEAAQELQRETERKKKEQEEQQGLDRRNRKIIVPPQDAVIDEKKVRGEQRERNRHAAIPHDASYSRGVTMNESMGPPNRRGADGARSGNGARHNYQQQQEQHHQYHQHTHSQSPRRPIPSTTISISHPRTDDRSAPDAPTAQRSPRWTSRGFHHHQQQYNGPPPPPSAPPAFPSRRWG